MSGRGPNPIPNPKPLLEHERDIIESYVARYLPDEVALVYSAVQWLEQREAHVIAVLRQAERCGGGYGFARQLLRYLGADQEEGRIG